MAKRKFLNFFKIKNHPILGDIDLNLVNPKTNKPYGIVAFVGENGCGKTTLLNELFNYDKSDFIIDKESEGTQHKILYLRQGSVHNNALKEVRKLIDGNDMFPNSTYSELSSENHSLNKDRVLQIIDELGDQQVHKLVEEDHLNDISCSGVVSQLIDGKEHGYNITSFSSGQQEVLLKLKDIQNLCSNDFMLLDEPETSLHPRWQKQIINLIREIAKDENGETPQIFLATHSEKVLESLIENKNALIVRLFKENGNISTNSIEEISLVLPKVTFAELDYVIFHISSLEYHDQLLTRVGDLYSVEAVAHIDKVIKDHPLYNKDNYYKKWSVMTKSGEVNYKTLPVYIRNYFHHPKAGKEPTQEEVDKSILFLRAIIKQKLDE